MSLSNFNAVNTSCINIGMPDLLLDVLAMKRSFSAGVWRLALAGGIAGCCYWTTVFPIDVTKANIQVHAREEPRDCFNQLECHINFIHG